MRVMSIFLPPATPHSAGATYAMATADVASSRVAQLSAKAVNALKNSSFAAAAETLAAGHAVEGCVHQARTPRYGPPPTTHASAVCRRRLTW
jgi:hypothetical protein